jgi:hypothetical protein
MISANLIAQSAADVWHIEINPKSDRLLDRTKATDVRPAACIMAAGWVLAAVIMAITIIGLPWARASFNIRAEARSAMDAATFARDRLRTPTGSAAHVAAEIHRAPS